MSLEQDIVKIIEEKKSIKAREIAEILGLTTTDINSKLYGVLKSQLVQDKKYNWSIRKVESSVSSKTSVESLAPLKNNNLARLSRYYLECLSKEIGQGIDEFSSNFNGLPKYCQIDGVPSLTDGFSIIPEKINSYVNTFRKNRNNLSVCIGYPIVVSAQIAGSGNPYFKVKPLLVQKLDEDSFLNSELLLSEDVPYINPEALSYIEGLKPMELLSDMLVLNEDLGLNELESANLEEIALRLRGMRESWGWLEELDIQKLSETDLSKVTVGGIYNTCAVFLSEKSKYTQGLEKELDDLQRQEERQYAKQFSVN